MEDINILAIESSCDETAAAVVRNGREVLSNVIFSQIDLHTLYGGVVPEIASRKHIEKINPVIEEAMEKAGMTDVGRTLPSNYLYYGGDGKHNYFRTEWKGGTRWNYSLPSPYEN